MFLVLAILEIKIDIDRTDTRRFAGCLNRPAPDILARSTDSAASLAEYGHLVVDTLAIHWRHILLLIPPRNLSHIYGTRL